MSKTERLKEALLDRLLDILENGEEVVTREGDTVRRAAGSATLAVILAAVKGIPAAPESGAAVKAEKVSRFLQRYPAPEPKATRQ